jgi:hypothetical protein
VVEIGEHDVRELDLQQVELVSQDEREQEVERTREDVEVELETAENGHPAQTVGGRPDGRRAGRAASNAARGVCGAPLLGVGCKRR